MLVTPAYAQAAGGGGGAIAQFLPLILIFAIMYFLLIRPQQKKMKEHRAMVEALRQAYDVVIVSGANLAQHPWAGNFAIACDLTLLISPEAAGQSPALAECQAAASMTSSDLGIVLTAGGSAGVALHAA